MDKAVFVQNIKTFCKLKDVKPTVACRESGAGANLINMLERRGSIPSVEKVQLLAQYLGVSTSELLGETSPVSMSIPEHPYLVMRYDLLSKDDQQAVMDFIEFKVAQAEQKKRHSTAENKS